MATPKTLKPKTTAHDLRDLFDSRHPRHARIAFYSRPRTIPKHLWVASEEEPDAYCVALADYTEAENPVSPTEILNDRELKAEIEQARKMLKLEDDWDGEGSPAYSEDTLERAVVFLTTHSDKLRKLYRISLPVPRISPGPDGSIDIHWKRESWELLVNIPADAQEMAVFYGDNYGSQKIKGSLDPNTFNLGIASWLMT